MKHLILVALVAVVGCGRADNTATSFGLPLPHQFDETLVEDTESTPGEGESNTDETPVVTLTCLENRFLLCHVPEGSPTEAKWLCLPAPGVLDHLKNHESDYLNSQSTGLCNK